MTSFRKVTRIASAVCIVALSLQAHAQAATRARLEPMFASDLVINGVTQSDDGRLFLPVQQQRVGEGAQLVEVRDGLPLAYPDDAWNDWKPGLDGQGRFVGVNAVRVGPDGALWVVDRGSPGIGKLQIAHGAKLVRIDLATNRVTRVFPLAGVTQPWSFIDDVRFNGRHAYLTDAGDPSLIVLDLETGKARKVLHGHPSTVAQVPLVAEGKVVRDAQHKAVNLQADHLEVSPDGRWLYYQPGNGGLARIETRYLDDMAVTPTELAGKIEPFADTPPTGGTAMSQDGTIYLSDVDRKRVLAISPDGIVRTVLDDPRLIWVDAMWIDERGRLLMPAAQLNRTKGLNGGVSAVASPITLYAAEIDARPLRR